MDLTACQTHTAHPPIATMREAMDLRWQVGRAVSAEIASYLSMGGPACCPAGAFAASLTASAYRQAACRNCGGQGDAHRSWCGNDPDKALSRYVTGVRVCGGCGEYVGGDYGQHHRPLCPSREPARPEWLYGSGCCERWTPADGCLVHTGRPAMSLEARELG